MLAETFDGLTTQTGHDAAVDLLDRIEGNAHHHIDSLTTDTYATEKARFRHHEPLSFVDARIVAYMQTRGHGYLCGFNVDFDAVDEVSRLATTTNPYGPDGRRQTRAWSRS